MLEDIHRLTSDLIHLHRDVDLNGAKPENNTFLLNMQIQSLHPGQTLLLPPCNIQVEWDGERTLKAGNGVYNHCIGVGNSIKIRGQGDTSTLFIAQQDPIQPMHGHDPGIFGVQADEVEMSHLRLVMPYYGRAGSGASSDDGVSVEQGGTHIKVKQSDDCKFHHITTVDGHNGIDAYHCDRTEIYLNHILGAFRRDAIRISGDSEKVWGNTVNASISMDGENEGHMGIRLGGASNAIVTGNHCENIWYEAYSIEGGGVDLFPAPQGKSTPAHGNILANNVAKNCRWGFDLNAGWFNQFVHNTLINCTEGITVQHPNQGHLSGVTIRHNLIGWNTLIDCGGKSHPMILVNTKGYDDHGIVRCMDNDLIGNILTRTHQGPHIGRMIRIQAPDTRCMDNAMTIYPSENQTPNKQIIGIDIQDGAPSSNSRLSRNKLVNYEANKNLYGVVIRGKQHDDLLLDGNELYNRASNTTGSKALSITHTNHVLVRDTKIRGFEEAVHALNADVEESDTDSK